MPRPDGTPDPLDPDSPVRMDDPRMDRARGRKTIAELLEQSGNRRYASLPVELFSPALPEIPPERLAYLRQRRDEITAELRRRWSENGG